MSAPDKLGPYPWLTSDETKAVMSALHAGEPHGVPVARFVGGCVRNSLLGEPVSDIDIATSLEPQEVVSRMTAADIRSIPTGIEHGTITAVVNHHPYEITTLRKDVSTDGRRATIAYTDDWVEDAERRDFTMNAIYADVDGTLFDPVGGIEDAKKRLIRFIGDANDRVHEDYLRILRFFRFHAWYGSDEPDDEGMKACVDGKGELKRLSAERIQVELFKTLSAPNPIRVLRVMASIGILSEVLPEAERFDLLEALIGVDLQHFFSPDPVLRLGAFANLDETGVVALGDRLRFSNETKSRLNAMAAEGPKVFSYMSALELRRALYRLGKEAFVDKARLGWAADPKTTNAVQWRALIAMAESWERPELPLTGEDVMKAGVPKGPEIGRVMREVESWWVDADFTDDRFSIIERLKAIVQATVF